MTLSTQNRHTPVRRPRDGRASSKMKTFFKKRVVLVWQQEQRQTRMTRRYQGVAL
jgi:hypothetical protein